MVRSLRNGPYGGDVNTSRGPATRLAAAALLAWATAGAPAHADGGGGDQTQGQAQAQGQSQQQAVTATGGAATGGVASATATVQGGAAAGPTVTVPRHAPAVGLADLVAAPESCMGSTTGAVSFPFSVFGGLGFGTTWRSEPCERRMNARTLMALGLRDAALALMAQDASVARALRAAGVAVRTGAEEPPPPDGAGPGALDAMAAPGQ